MASVIIPRFEIVTNAGLSGTNCLLSHVATIIKVRSEIFLNGLLFNSGFNLVLINHFNAGHTN